MTSFLCCLGQRGEHSAKQRGWRWAALTPDTQRHQLREPRARGLKGHRRPHLPAEGLARWAPAPAAARGPCTKGCAKARTRFNTEHRLAAVGRGCGTVRNTTRLQPRRRGAQAGGDAELCPSPPPPPEDGYRWRGHAGTSCQLHGLLSGDPLPPRTPGKIPPILMVPVEWHPLSPSLGRRCPL